MSIPIDPISIDLTKDTPTPLTPETLQAELKAIGLGCKFTEPNKLKALIRTVDSEVNYGKLESYKILKPANDSSDRLEGFVQDLKIASKGNWQSRVTVYDPMLEYIQQPEVFKWLKETDPTFTGISEEVPPDTLLATTVAAIRDFFATTLSMASSVVIQGINKDTLHSVMSNAMGKMKPNVKDYEKKDSRAIFLVEDYDPNTKSAAAVGVVAMEWYLMIHDYQESSNQPIYHKATLSIKARGVQYADIKQLERNYNDAKKHFGESAFELYGIPIPSPEVEIYKQQPPANGDTFNHSLPLNSTTQYLDRIVMFAPDIESIASVDNTSKNSVASYLKSVATGFSFTATQSLSITAGFEVTIEVVKASLSVTLSIGFSEQWSTVTTETIDFSVPPGKKGFLYQGTLKSRILRYDPTKVGKRGESPYEYLDMGMLKTTVFAVSDIPLDPSSPTRMVEKA